MKILISKIITAELHWNWIYIPSETYSRKWTVSIAATGTCTLVLVLCDLQCNSFAFWTAFRSIICWNWLCISWLWVCLWNPWARWHIGFEINKVNCFIMRLCYGLISFIILLGVWIFWSVCKTALTAWDKSLKWWLVK